MIVPETLVKSPKVFFVCGSTKTPFLVISKSLGNKFWKCLISGDSVPRVFTNCLIRQAYCSGSIRTFRRSSSGSHLTLFSPKKNSCVASSACCSVQWCPYYVKGKNITKTWWDNLASLKRMRPFWSQRPLSHTRHTTKLSVRGWCYCIPLNGSLILPPTQEPFLPKNTYILYKNFNFY